MSRATNITELLELAMDEKVARVVRKGKVVRKVICKPGYKADGNRCVKIGGKELINKKKGAKKAARTKRGKSKSQANRSRKISNRKRKSMS